MLLAAALALTIAAVPPQLPPMIVQVTAAHDITPTLVTALLAETDAVWRGSGITFLWVRNETVPARSLAEPARQPLSLHVSIGHARRHDAERLLPLGWIVFEDPTTPEREIYVSYENAVALLEGSPGVVGQSASMPRLQRETLLARAMGRAL